MKNSLLGFPVLFLSSLLGFSGAARADEPGRHPIELEMFAVPEALWQQKLEGKFQENPALWQALDKEAAEGRIEKPLQIKQVTEKGNTLEHRHGQDVEYDEAWQPVDGFEGVKPIKRTQRYVGTSVTLTDEGLNTDGYLLLGLKLEHHTASPVMKKHNYANTATGAERDRLAVEYPEFSKIEWKGKTTAWHEWRLVTQMLDTRGGDSKDAKRYLIFIRRVRP